MVLKLELVRDLAVSIFPCSHQQSLLKFLAMQKNSKQYSGEFVLTSDGNIDFGEIPREIASQIKRQAGKIRLRIGKQVNGV